VVTLLTPEPLELLLVVAVLGVVVVLAVVVLGVVVVVLAVVVDVLGVDATVVADDVVDVLLASAGSWPETSTMAIISQAATNTATAPEMTRRRILRARATRSLRIAWPRARAAACLESVIRVPRDRRVGRVSQRRDQLRPRPYQPREEGLRGA
jgi:hypothetical protein